MGIKQNFFKGLVDLSTLLAGEDQSRDVLKTADGLTQYYLVNPVGTPAGDMPVSNKALGATGSVGDQIKHLSLNVRNNTNAAVYLQDGDVADVLGGTTGTNPTASASISVTASSSFTAAQNLYSGYVLRITYTPTSAGTTVTFKRRIVSHAAVAASTTFAPTLSHALPAGATITSWAIEPLASSYEVCPYNTAAGVYTVAMGKKSVNGRWKLSID